MRGLTPLDRLYMRGMSVASSEAGDTLGRILVPVLADGTTDLIALSTTDNVFRWIHVWKVGSLIACRTRIVFHTVVT